ncbi:MAG TPA: DUF4274 domain-containing protein [Allosphingosinicella sp.]|jgi:hypothetical protein
MILPNWWKWLIAPGSEPEPGLSGPAAQTARSWRERPSVDPADLPGPSAKDALIWWLARQDRRELHRVALNWNWDTSTRPLRYIVDRPDCDKGTALTIFFSGEPEQYASHNLSGPYHRPDYQRYFQEPLKLSDDDFLFEEGLWLLRRISENWARGFYRSFDFYPGENAVYWLATRPVEHRLKPADLPWPVPDELCAAVPQGEVLDTWGYHEGFPVEICDALDRRPDIHP